MTYTTRTPPEDFVSDTLGSAAVMNMLPRGRIGRSTLSADTDPTSSTVVACSITFEGEDAIPPDRTLQVHGSVTVRSAINPGGARAALYEDGVQIQRKNIDALNEGVDQSWSLEIEVQPDAGDHTYDLVVGTSGDDGNEVRAVANGPTGTHGVTVLYVDDVGPAYAPGS